MSARYGKASDVRVGRGVEYYDAPAIRKIVASKSGDFRFTSIILIITAHRLS